MRRAMAPSGARMSVRVEVMGPPARILTSCERVGQWFLSEAERLLKYRQDRVEFAPVATWEQMNDAAVAQGNGQRANAPRASAVVTQNSEAHAQPVAQITREIVTGR